MPPPYKLSCLKDGDRWVEFVEHEDGRCVVTRYNLPELDRTPAIHRQAAARRWIDARLTRRGEWVTAEEMLAR